MGARDYQPEVTLKSLWAYEVALQQFSSVANPALIGPHSFEQLARATDNGVALPPVREFSLRDGAVMRARTYEGASRTHLVLVHGSACFGDQFHALATQVSKAGLARVTTLNLRGHGLDEGPRGHAVGSPRQLVKDIEDTVRALRAAHPEDKFLIGGHSAGGGLVLGFARSAAAELASGFVFLAPFLGLGSATNRPWFGGWMVKFHAWRIRLLSFLNVLGIRRFNHSTTVVEFNIEPSQDDRYVKSWSFNTVLAFGPGRWVPDAAPLPADTPVLLLAGAPDECFVQSKYAEAFARVAPHAEMPAVGPSGHFDLLVDPLTIEHLSGWLRRLANETDAVRPQPESGVSRR